MEQEQVTARYRGIQGPWSGRVAWLGGLLGKMASHLRICRQAENTGEGNEEVRVCLVVNVLDLFVHTINFPNFKIQLCFKP
jgi:hypothetical protein